MNRIICLVASVAFSLTRFASAGADEGALKAALDSWKQLRDEMFQLSGRIITTQETWSPSEDGSSVYRQSDTFNFLGDRRLLVSIGANGSGDEEVVFCTNADYAFRLKRPAGQRYQLDRWDQFPDDIVRRIEQRMAVQISRMLYNIPIEDIVQGPGFSIVRYEPADENGYIRLEFTSNYANEAGVRLTTGRVELDPHRLYAVQGYEIRQEYDDGPATVVGRNTFGEAADDTPVKYLPVTSTVEMRDSNLSRLLMRIERSYASVKVGDLAESDCRLPAFGLPELNSLGTRSLISRTLLFWNLVGLGMLCLGAWIRRKWSSSAS